MTHVIITDSVFDAAQKATLQSLAELMIPAEDELPSAGDPAIFVEILARLAERADVAADGIARIAAFVRGQEFSMLPAADRLEAVARLRTECPAFLTLFESAVAACYYRDDRVLSSLGMPPRAPYPEGNAVAPTDWSMLDPVRERAPFYRSA
jgi:hypothetical protein